MTDFKLSNDARTRIKTMCDTNDGFKISEVDLQLRGPGNLEGTQQSGNINLRIANLATDGRILEEARNVALKILEDDEQLQLPQHQNIKQYLYNKTNRSGKWSNVS
jgi:ATP-dependent DNA helicase RecG